MAKSIVYSNNPLLYEGQMGDTLKTSKKDEAFDFSYK